MLRECTFQFLFEYRVETTPRVGALQQTGKLRLSFQGCFLLHCLDRLCIHMLPLIACGQVSVRAGKGGVKLNNPLILRDCFIVAALPRLTSLSASENRPSEARVSPYHWWAVA